MEIRRVIPRGNVHPWVNASPHPLSPHPPGVQSPSDNPAVDPARAEILGRPPDRRLAAAAALLTLVLLALVHGPIVTNPNGFAFGNEGEAVRNYFALAWHAAQGESLHEFTGMNYPFGEQIVYSEGQPSLSYPLKIGSRLLPGLARRTMGVLNGFLLLGVVASAALLVLVLRRFSIPGWMAMTAAVGMALLGPQSTRLPWMFPQAFCALVPLSMLLVVGVVDAGWGWRWLTALSGANLFFLFLNPYPGLIASTFTGLALAAAWCLGVSPAGQRGRDALATVVSVGAPVGVFQAYLRMTDHHVGRTPLPAGFLDFTSEPASVLGSFSSPFMPWISLITGHTSEQAWSHFEGNGYLGLFCLAALPLGFAGWAWAGLRGAGAAGGPDRRLIGAMVAGAAVLAVFAFGVPLRWIPDGENRVVLLGPLAQFRAPGRFIWPLFYVANLLALVVAARAVARAKTRPWRLVVTAGVTAGLMAMVVEGVAQHRWVSGEGGQPVNFFDRQLVDQTPSLEPLASAIRAVEPSRYQAILTVPLFHIGSELLVPPRPFSVAHHHDAMVLAFHLRLPLMSSNLGRISRQESIATFRLYTPPFVGKTLCSELSGEPLLVVVNRDRALDPDEERVAGLGRSLHRAPRFELRHLEVAELCRDRSGERLAELRPRLSDMESRGGCRVDGDGTVVLERFENQPARVARRGRGALEIPPGDIGWFFDSAALPVAMEVGVRYELSFWFYNVGQRLRAEAFIEADPPGGPPGLHSQPGLLRTFHHDSEWSLFTQELTLSHRSQRVRLGLRSRTGEFLAVDEVLLRPRAVTTVWDVSSDGPGEVASLVWNNHRLDESANEVEKKLNSFTGSSADS